MSPFHFSIDELLQISPHDFAARLLETDAWQSFAGFGSIPAIKTVAIENPAADTGTTIRISNADSSTCLATITEWRPDYRLAMKVTDFSPPLADSISRIEETWELEPAPDGQTKVTRLVKVFPNSEKTADAAEKVALDLKKAMLLH